MPFIYFLIFLFIAAPNIQSQEVEQKRHSSYEGRHFYVGFMDNEVDYYRLGEYFNFPNMYIYISSKFETKVTIRKADQVITETIPKNKILNLDIKKIYEHRTSEEVFNDKLIEITSEKPVSVVVKSSFNTSTDKYSIIPTKHWGTEHYVVSAPNDYYIDDPNDTLNFRDPNSRTGEYLLMAKENNTEVEIYTTSNTQGGEAANSIFNITLNKGESYLVKAKETYGMKGLNDLSGSRIRSDKPIGVISGHMRTALMQQYTLYSIDTKDHIAEMLPPTSAWGGNYFTIPFSEINTPNNEKIESYFKVVAKDDINLQIESSNTFRSISMNAGDVKDFTDIDVPTRWSSDGQFMIVQFMAKYRAHDYSVMYDPSMVVIPPIEQYINYTTYFASNEEYGNDLQFQNQAIMIVADEKAKSCLKVNGKLVQDEFGDFSPMEFDNGFGWFSKVVELKTIEPQTIHIEADSGKFCAVPYGNGIYDSYAMNVGSSLIPLGENDTIPPVVHFNEDCYEIEGYTYDEKVIESSGIYNIVVDEDRSYNYEWEMSKISDSTTYAEFSASPVDMLDSARIYITVYDNHGNSQVYELTKPPVNVDLPDEIDFGTIATNNDTCTTFKFYSNSDSVTLEGVTYPDDLRLKLEKFIKVPHTFNKGDSTFFELCIEHDGTTKRINDSLVFDFGCGITKTVGIKAYLIAYSMANNNLDFEKILVGDTICTDDSQFIYFDNDGDSTIVINSIEFPESDNFIIDTTGLFPDTLEPGERLKIDDICFTGDKLGDFSIEIVANDDQDINPTAYVTGKTGRPVINDIVYDFGRVRVGDSREETFELSNIGNFDAELKRHLLNSTLGSNDPNFDLIIENNYINLDEEGGTKEFEFIYNPTDVNDFDEYIFTARYTVDWDPHDTVNIRLTGQPTLPVIKTYEIDFDTLVIYNSKDIQATLIESLGNEKLTIIDVNKVSGDENKFEYDNMLFNSPRTIDTNTSEEYNVTFNADELGYHEYIIEVISDAKPNYEEATDTIKFYGYVIPDDTLAADISEVNKTLTACVYDTLDFSITNRGNTDFYIKSIDVIENDVSSYFIDPVETDTLSPGESYYNNLNTLISRDKQGTIDINVTVYDIKQQKDSSFSTRYIIESKTDQLIIDPMDFSSVSIGDEFIAKFSGEFPFEIDTTIDFDYKINFDIFTLHLVDNETIINLLDKNSNIVRSIPVNFVNNSSNVHLQSNNLKNIDLKGVKYWEFDARFLVLLHTELKSPLGIGVETTDCFTKNEISEVVNLNEICIYNLRPIVVGDKISDPEITPNIVEDELEVSLEVFEKTEIEFEAVNTIGQKISLSGKRLFEKGENNIIFNISGFVNGKYLLILRTDRDTITKKFIISK